MILPQNRLKMQSRPSNTRHHTDSFLSERENRENIMNAMMGRWTRLGRVGRARQELDVHPELFVTVDVVVAGAF